jgi:DNA polymerase I-like protein with 3'-5' exonuclease and polymerase domains
LNKYGCQKGFLQTLQQSSSTYAAMITVFCNRLGWYNLEILVNQFQSRLMFGVQRQLLDLVRIKLLNSHRARLFYNAGYTTVASLAVCDLKKIEKILRSGMTFSVNSNNGNKQDDYNNSEAVIWHDNKGYTYWEASAAILEDANELLRNDLEQLGVKVQLENKDNENGNKQIIDKSIFHFNETVDSMIQSQRSKSPPRQDKSKILEVESKTSSQKCPINIVENKAAETPQDENKLSKDNNKVIENQVENVEQMQIVEEQVIVQTQSTASNSQIDDQFLLEIADTFESKKPIINKIIHRVKHTPNTTPVRKTPSKDINTTIVSDDILEMCEIFEKNALSSSKKSTKRDKAVENENISKKESECKKSLQFSFGDETLRNILNTQVENAIIPRESPKKQSATKSSTELCDKLRVVLKDLEKATSFQINLIQNIQDLELLLQNSLKPKSVISVSLSCEKVEFDSDKFEFFEFYDYESNHRIRLYGFFLSTEAEKSKKLVNFVALLNGGCKVYMNSIRKIFEREDLMRVMFYSKQHFRLIFKALSISMKMPCYDPIIANWLLNHEMTNIFQIKQKYCSNLNFLNVDSFFKNRKSCYGCNLLSSSELKTSLNGALTECLIGLFCFEKVKLQLQLQNIWIYYAKIESDIVLLSGEIELYGFGLNTSELDNIKCQLLKKKKEIEDRVRFFSGREINLNSPDDVASIVYDKLKLKPIVDEKKTPSMINNDKFKHHKTSKDILQQLASQHEFPKLVILWRKINHTLSNSIYPIERCKTFCESTKMHRIFPSIDLFTVTGRMNFYNPCLQHIPRDFDISIDHFNSASLDVDEFIANTTDSIKIDDFNEAEVSVFFLEKINENSNQPKIAGKNCISLRNAFICRDNYVLLSADYCQLEFRIITNLCKDEGLISAFNDNPKGDVFNSLASKWLNLPVEQIDEEKRQNVKKIIYGIIYGISAKTLALFLNLNESEATNFIDSFKNTFPALKKFIHTQVENCRLKGYVETIRKRRRNLPNITNMDNKQRAQVYFFILFSV